MAIIQNALKIWDGDKIIYLISTHVHDFQSHTCKNGAAIMIDGGNEYLRRGHTVSKDTKQEMHNYEYWSLDDSQSIHEISQKLLWGTRGKKGDKPLEYKPLCELSKSHLKAILKTQKQIKNTICEQVINLLLDKVSNLNDVKST